jgi:pimeloyl-ACP methyl ester carboxylesterase
VSGSLVPAGDTELYVVERGSGHPLFLLHGEPGDHHMFADYLDPLAERFRLLLVDLRGHGLSAAAPLETCTLEQMARDVSALAASLGLERYAVLGHSMGSFVALQHAVDSPGAAAQTIVSSGVPALRFLDGAIAVLDAFEPEDLRDQIMSSIEREATAETSGEVTALMRDQLPVHFADPRDPRITDYADRTADSVYRPETLRHLAATDYGSIDVEHRLADILQPVLVLAGGSDRICPPAASEAIAAGAPRAELVVLEDSGHFTFVEENERYIAAVADFLDRHTEEHP